MILKIRTPNLFGVHPTQLSVYVKRSESSVSFAAEILEVIPELSEKEKLLSKIFDLGISQDTKEVLAKLVNKAYEE
jgi:hypothetical protein